MCIHYPSHPILRENTNMDTLNQYHEIPAFAEMIIRLSEVAAKRKELGGGKAANLAALLDVGFPVPNGVIITTKAYSYFISQASESNVDLHNFRTLLPESFIQAILNVISKVVMSENHSILQNKPQFAVRSSATGEDTGKSSYAGVFTTFLNVDFEDIPFYIAECWKSSLNDGAKHYKNGLDHESSSLQLAVLVQPMIQAKVVGVAFTADPVTLDSSRIVVTAFNGSGLSEVDGMNNPSCIIFERRDAEFSVDSLQAQDIEMTVDAIRYLGDRLLAVESFFRVPVDVEWCWDGEIFWILQARPITSLNFGNLGTDIVWSSTNLKEILPHIPTPSTWSALSYAMNYAFKKLAADFGYQWPITEAAVANIWGRGYMNLSRLCDTAWQLFGITSGSITEALGGAHTEAIASSDKHFVKRISLGHIINLMRFSMKCSRVASKSDVWFQDNLRSCEGIRDRLRQPISVVELIELINTLKQETASFMYYYLLLVFGAIGSYTFLKKAIGHWTKLDVGSVGFLLTGLGDVPSADMVRRILLMVEMASHDPITFQWLNRRDWGKWEKSQITPKFKELIDDFLSNYGHRTTESSEYEMASPRWLEDPGTLFEILRNCCLSPSMPHNFSFEVQQQRRVSAEAEFMGSLPFYLRFPVRMIMLQAQRYSRLREAAKNSLLHLVAVGREMMLLAGKVLTKNKVILGEDDIFFLSLQDILDGLAGEKGHLAEIIQETKIRAARFDKIEPADVFIGSKPFYLDLNLPDRVTLKGIAASPGRVTAPARVLHSPSEGPRLTAGEILVCPTIDSLWIATFFLASGIIAEIGGVLSHGAIIARELGIPMVINVSGAMSNITDGQILTVDGNLGSVFT